MISRGRFRAAAGGVASTLAFSAGLAAMIIVFGTRDLESYEHVFFSLDRGTALESVHVFGHPVYTLAVGLGVRLPLQASLGASPVAAVSPYLLAPVTYWLLLAVSIATAVLIVRHALEPLCGRLVSWAAVVLLFCSVPIVTYTVYNDWPEVVVTYCAFVGCVFAPHALLAMLDSQRPSHIRRLGSLSLAGLVWGLVALSHPGYWPLLAVAIVCATGVALCRSDYPLRTRLTIVVLLGTVSLIAVAVQVPDITRELDVAGGGTAAMRRYTEGPAGSLIAANAFPFGNASPKSPFTYLVLALVSLAIGLASRDVPARRLIVASALVSIALAVGAATLLPGSAPYAPSGTWALRDPAAIFAVLSGACAAGAVARSRAGKRLVGAGLALAALAFAGAQGPSYAVRLVFTNTDGPLLRGLFVPQWRDHRVWTRDMTAPAERVSMRGLARDRVLPGERLALWPGVRDRMRTTRHASTDFADAGYPLVTAWTKQRTMRGLVEPNEFLFNQTTDLSSQVLCDAGAVRFLQLRYLLTPSDVECEPWRRLPGLLVDGWLEVRVATQSDDRVSALPVAGVSQRTRGEPALSVESLLLPALAPLPGTSLRIGPRNVVIGLDDSSAAAGRSLVLPVAYDPAWHASSGHIQNIGGLLALVGVDQRQVTLDFVPDIVAVVRALSMTVAQVFAVVGFLGLASVRRVAADDAAIVAFARVPLALSANWARRVFAVIAPILRQPRNWLYLGYSAAVAQRLDWRPEDSDETRLLIGLLLPIIALTVANLARLELCARWIGGAVLALALVRVGTYGSLSAQALHDPLFWGATALVALGVSGISGRRPAASAAAALAGVCTMVGILLPMFPGFDSAFPDLNFTVINQSFSALSYQLGVSGAALLLSMWLHAIVIGGRRGNGVTRIGAAARGALLAALVLALAGVVPTTEGIGPGWIAALGILLGLAEATVPSKPDENDRR